MSDDSRHDGLADVINLLAAPIAGGIRTVEQFRRGVEELFRAIDNVNRTMENLNEAAARINRVMGEIEEPLRTMMPQVTRTVKTADEITSLLEAPVRAAAPRIERIVETLSSPGLMALPAQLGELMQRLGPLTQLAESAGGLFGGLRLATTKPTPPPAEPTPKPTPKKSTPAKKATPKKKPARSVHKVSDTL
jgi:ABC-type transporter Mla subunit MlaD